MFALHTGFMTAPLARAGAPAFKKLPSFLEKEGSRVKKTSTMPSPHTARHSECSLPKGHLEAGQGA